MEVRNKKGDNALLLAIDRRKYAILDVLLDETRPNHADVNAGGNEHPSVLYVAAQKGMYDVVLDLIITREAKVNKVGGMCNTALTVAARSGYTSVVWKLLEYGADKTMSGGILPNALSAAIRSQSDDIIDDLFEDSTTLNQPDLEGRISVHIASCHGA
jgi:ankyrin repeat protein